MCGYRTCEEFRTQLAASPESIRRCIHLSEDVAGSHTSPTRERGQVSGPSLALRAGVGPIVAAAPDKCATACGSCAAIPTAPASGRSRQEQLPWKDSLGRDIDFYLEHFPEEPGPREIILPHNPLITREMEVRVGDILIGRPLGMSCGCPITHCGVATQVDTRTGVIVWCVTGPLGPRQKGFKDLGYYIAEGYEGLVKDTRAELKVGLRYFFQPRMCMLQWRHSGLLNYLNRIGDHWQVRLEGLWIG